MSTLWRFIRRDAKNVFRNVISLVVCSGLIVLPSFYAWFNIAGSWDPYGNTASLRVAVANSDEGYRSDLVPIEVNIGDSVVGELRESTTIGYEFVGEDDALEGVRSGEYYAAVVIPRDFSANMMTVLAGEDAVHPTLYFYSNEKENAIASIVTGKVSTSVQQLINESFTDAVVDVCASVLDEIVDYLGDDEVLAVAAGAQASLEDTSQELWNVSGHLHGYADLVSSMQELLDSSGELLSGSSSSVGGTGRLLRESASGVREVDTGVSAAADSLKGALSGTQTTFDSIDAAINQAFADASDDVSAAQGALSDARDVVNARRDSLMAVYAALDAIDGQLRTFSDTITLDGSYATAEITSVNTAEADVSGIKARVHAAALRLDELSEGLMRAIDDLGTTMSDASATKAELQELAAEARGAVSSVESGYDSSLAGALASLATSIEAAADTADAVTSQLDDTLESLDATIDTTSAGLSDVYAQILGAADSLDAAVGRIDDLIARLKDALSGDSVDTIRTIIGGDPTALAAYISAPVEQDRVAVFPIENNGSAMTPYYTSMAIWVGGTLMGILVSAKASEDAIAETGAKPRHAYFGRLAFFVTMSLLQSTLIILGDIYVLGIQCEHPWLLLLVGWVDSFVFINIIYSLTVAFGDVGKAIAVLIMVVQVAGSGGTFPMEMLPEAFQRVYPFLPFVHSENAMRAAIAGVWGTDYLVCIIKLLLFLVPALLLGLLLSKPLVRVNEWVEEKMESTKLM